jgi:hypothetical protein
LLRAAKSAISAGLHHQRATNQSGADAANLCCSSITGTAASINIPGDATSISQKAAPGINSTAAMSFCCNTNLIPAALRRPPRVYLYRRDKSALIGGLSCANPARLVQPRGGSEFICVGANGPE